MVKILVSFKKNANGNGVNTAVSGVNTPCKILAASREKMRTDHQFSSMPRIASIWLLLPTASALLLRPTLTSRSASVKMQYGAQQGYSTQTWMQPFGDQQGYNAQQTSGATRTWRVAGFNGIQGHSKQDYEGLGAEGYGVLPYSLKNGDEFVLSRWNMVQQKLSVSRVQAVVQVLADGNALLISRGKGETGFRTPGGYWSWLSTGQSHILADGDHISLDVNDPEAAVFMIHDCTPDDPVPGQQGGLPAGWVSEIDQQSGQTFYYNEQTGQSQWEPPQGAGGGLPAGWVSEVDQQSGQTFYYNEQTGQSQWEYPQ